MADICTQSDFQRWKKPGFCYLCGYTLEDGTPLNSDHCPPKGMFAVADRQNYPLLFKVHAKCNHNWHRRDEQMAIFLDYLHGGRKAANPELQKKLTMVSVKNDQGIFQAITNFPLRPLAYRVMRGMHALLYGTYLPENTPHHIHYPLPEVDFNNGNRPVQNEIQTYRLAQALCTAQKTNTCDRVVAYNGKFRYACTWDQYDNGQPICIFAFDIYRINRFAIEIEDFTEAFVGHYSVNDVPIPATWCSKLEVQHSRQEVLYPLL